MLGRSDTIIEEIYKRIKHIVDDVYRKKGMTSLDIRNYFSNKKNFNKLIKVMGDLKHIYKQDKYPLSFEDEVRDILFYRILMDRIYYEKDNPQEESNLGDYDDFVASKSILSLSLK